MGLGDGADDRQAEPRAGARARRRRRARSARRRRRRGRPRPGPESLTSSSSVAPSRRRAQHHVALAVAQRVVHQVAQRLAQAQRVDLEHEPVRRASVRISRPRSAARSANRLRTPSSSSPASIGSRRTGSAPSAERASTSRSSASWARRSHSSTAATSDSRALGPEVVRPQRRLELGLDHRHGRAQLVAGVGHELPLALERGAQAVEHLVQRLAEGVDLVPGRGQRQPLVAVLQRHLGRAAAHRLHRSQRTRGQA